MDLGEAQRVRGLVSVQVPLNFPGRDVPDVAVPFRAFGGEEVLEDVFANGIAHEIAFREFIERLAQVAGEFTDAKVPPLAVAHSVDVLVHRRTWVELAVDAVEPGAQHDRQRKVRVA